MARLAVRETSSLRSARDGSQAALAAMAEAWLEQQQVGGEETAEIS